MGVTGRLGICCVFLWLGVGCALAVKTVFIEDCIPGKYFWQESSPGEFYACLTVPKKAVKMTCATGTYMCNSGPDLFMPCSCQGVPKVADDSSKQEKTIDISKKLDKTASGKVKDTASILAEQHTKLDDPVVGTSNDIRSRAFVDLSLPADENTDMTYPRENVVDMYNTETEAPDTETEAPNKKAILNGDDLSLPHNGCPNDDFKLVANAHMYAGTTIAGSLLECQQNCIGQDHCMGVDWNRVTKTCFFLDINNRETIKYGLNYHDEIDHYRRTHCYSTIAPYGGQVTDSQVLETDTPGITDPPSRTLATQPITTAPPVITTATRAPTASTPSLTTPQVQPTETTPPKDTTTTVTETEAPVDLAAVPVAKPAENPSLETFNSNTNGFIPTTTTTFPDSGCPFTLAKYVHTSHPFGQYVSEVATMEQCKIWCIKYSFCAGVDFDARQNKCYLLREILADKVENSEDVTHFRKIDCAPPLRCWSEDKYALVEEDLSVADENTPQTACQGVCFVSQTLSTDGTAIQRGCMTITDPTMADVPLGCSVDSTLMTIVCFCDTPRCNGLSIAALASQMLYLPLDGDFRDHSGVGRDGVVPVGFTEPSFSCLDKAVNCSAMFDGSSCVAVNSMAAVQWGNTDFLTDDFIPSATFCVWFKRATTKNSMQLQGMFGNSLDTTQPSWQFMAEMMDNFVGAGISTAGDAKLDDYPWQPATNDEWHLACLTYQGILDTAAQRFPLLRFYIDGQKLMGNSRADKGEIGVRSQPVTVGCVQENSGFIGFLDEARIFNLELSMADIQALQVMRESQTYW